MKTIEKIMDISIYTTVKDWRKCLLTISNELGFERTLLAIFPDRSCPREAEFAFLQSNYGSVWRDKYDREKFGLIDPTVSHCITRSTPLIWTPDIFSSVPQKELYEEACLHGIRAGVTLPIHGPNGEYGLLCVVSDINPNKQFQEDVLRRIHQLTLFRDFVHESSLAFIESSMTAVYPREVALTPREIECLKWTAAGKSAWDISQILNCATSTVNYHMSSIRLKFNTYTKQQAVTRAILMGIIVP